MRWPTTRSTPANTSFVTSWSTSRRSIDGAFTGELELTAVSLHAYAYLTDKYALCPCGASMGDRYGPMVVARSKSSLERLREKTIAVPGTLTTAYLALRMCLARDFKHVVVPFDQILDAVVAGQYQGQRSTRG